VCAGVGLHFLPLSRALDRLLLVPLGLLVTAVAAAALIVGLTTTVIPSTITGVGTGLCLLVAAALTLTNLTRRPSAASTADARTPQRSHRSHQAGMPPTVGVLGWR